MSTTDDPQLELTTLAEPYRAKVVEAIRLPTRAERERILERAFHSIAYINAEDVFIDLATDSGTGAMSDAQWAGMMRGDESYIRSRSYYELEKTVREITGFQYVVPTHQGRGAENILMELLVLPDAVVVSNTHFDTSARTSRIVRDTLDLVGDCLWDFNDEQPFKGNFDLDKLRIALERYHARVPFILITILNNLACSSLSRWRTSARHGGSLTASTSLSISTPVGSRRTLTSSRHASPATVTNPSRRSSTRCSRMDTAAG